MSAEVAEMLPIEEFGTQICTGPCGRQLPFSEFAERPDHRLGVARRCKRCMSEYSRDWNLRHPDRYYEKHLLRNFGITLAEYEALAEQQGGACAICGGPPTDRRNRRRGGQRNFRARLVVDHDHATGKIRGLLCSTCNTGIGSLKDDPAIVRRALDYLERE